jgi:hypothetical protein
MIDSQGQPVEEGKYKGIIIFILIFILAIIGGLVWNYSSSLGDKKKMKRKKAVKA